VAIEREFRAAMVVRKQKRLDAPGQSIDFGPDRPFPYGITRTEGEWMWIEPMAGGPKGWVRVRIGEESAWSLRSWMPELAYIDAVTGFMRLRASTPAVTEPARLTRLSAWIEQAFARFETAVSADEANTAYGLARAMRGFILWDRRGEAEARSSAARLFAEAKTLLSEYAAARNLAAVTHPFMADRLRLDKDVIEKMGMDLLAAIALEPRNKPALANLEALYAFARRQPDVSPFSVQDLTHRLAIVRTARTQAGSQ
jgi:hypothetical protein